MDETKQLQVKRTFLLLNCVCSLISWHTDSGGRWRTGETFHPARSHAQSHFIQRSPNKVLSLRLSHQRLHLLAQHLRWLYCWRWGTRYINRCVSANTLKRPGKKRATVWHSKKIIFCWRILATLAGRFFRFFFKHLSIKICKRPQVCLLWCSSCFQQFVLCLCASCFMSALSSGFTSL